MQLTDFMPIFISRIATAREHIDDFKLKSGKFFDTNPYAIVSEEEPKGANKIIRYRFIVRREVSAGLRIPITSCILELRSTLDNLVWGLSQVVGEPPSSKIGFPVCEIEFASIAIKQKWCFKAWLRQYQSIISKFPTGAIDLIRQLQPFNPYKGSQTGTNHPIYILNSLANQDKHKMPLKVTGINQDGPMHLSRSDGRPVTISAGTTFQFDKTLEHNSVILEMTMPASQPIDNFQVSAVTYIAFDKNSPAPNAPVYEFLINMHDFVRDEVIAKFEPFFPK